MVVSTLAAVLLLVMGTIYLTSLWWAPRLCRVTAEKTWGAKFEPSRAAFNPFTLGLTAAGGTFRVPYRKGMTFSGELGRLEVQVDLIPLIRENRLGEVALEVPLLILEVDRPGGKRSSRRPPAPLPVPVKTQKTGSGGNDDDPGKIRIDRLHLRVDEGIVKYRTGENSGETTVSLNHDAVYNDVTSFSGLGEKILEDLALEGVYERLLDRLLG